MASTDVAGIDRWFIGGGAEHSPESARRLVYTATAGASGVGRPNDLLVRPLTIPGAGVRVAIGSAIIPSRYVGGETQSYQIAAYRQVTVAIAANTTNQDRYDLVILRVEDPFAAGSTYAPPAAENIADEQYAYVRVISGVGAGVTRVQDIPARANDTAVTLARVRVPALTQTVQAAHITDLRNVAVPRRSEVVYARPRVLADDTQQRYLTARMANGGEYFPGGNGTPNEFQVEIPEWATRMIIDARWISVYYAASKNPYGRQWVEYGDEYRNHTWPDKKQYEFGTQHFSFNAPLTADERTADWGVMDEVGIPAKLRGKLCTFVFKAGLEAGAPAGNNVWMSSLGGLAMRITFAERAIDADLL